MKKMNKTKKGLGILVCSIMLMSPMSLTNAQSLSNGSLSGSSSGGDCLCEDGARPLSSSLASVGSLSAGGSFNSLKNDYGKAALIGGGTSLALGISTGSGSSAVSVLGSAAAAAYLLLKGKISLDSLQSINSSGGSSEGGSGSNSIKGSLASVSAGGSLAASSKGGSGNSLGNSDSKQSSGDSSASASGSKESASDASKGSVGKVSQSASSSKESASNSSDSDSLKSASISGAISGAFASLSKSMKSLSKKDCDKIAEEAEDVQSDINECVVESDTAQGKLDVSECSEVKEMMYDLEQVEVTEQGEVLVEAEAVEAVEQGLSEVVSTNIEIQADDAALNLEGFDIEFEDTTTAE